MNSTSPTILLWLIVAVHACTPAREPPRRDSGAVAVAPSARLQCAETEPLCSAGTTCITYRNYSGVEEHACDTPCGPARACPQGYGCTDYDDGPANVCRPLPR